VFFKFMMKAGSWSDTWVRSGVFPGTGAYKGSAQLTADVAFNGETYTAAVTVTVIVTKSGCASFRK
jgi:hypothetical protein